MSSDKEKVAITGCVVAIVTLFVQVPLFGAMLYGVIQACEAPGWVWVIFWIYVPVCFLLGVFRSIIEALTKMT